MSQLNVKEKKPAVFTHEGGRASHTNAEEELKRAVMSCMLWEDSFYESGEDISQRIARLTGAVSPQYAAACAAHARGNMHLRHVPLLIVREMARLPQHKALVANLLADVIMRPDEITEFLAIYWKDKRQPLSAQVKKGLAKAFTKFNEYQLAKYNRDGKVKLRDALFLSHSKPADVPTGYVWTKEHRAKGVKMSQRVSFTASERLYQRLVNNELQTPDTWEVQLSAGADKAGTFTRLMDEGKLGALAFLRNLRNMVQAGVNMDRIKSYAMGLNVERVLPYRFIAAARVVPQLEPMLEPLMMKCLEGQTKLAGRTVLLIDISGSMDDRLSDRSDMRRIDAANGLAILLRELCDDVEIYTFSAHLKLVPPRHGFALRDAVMASQPMHGTYLARSMNEMHATKSQPYDRLIVITDEQTHDGVMQHRGQHGYILNVAGYQRGVGYGHFTHISGFSEAVVDYIKAFEER